MSSFASLFTVIYYVSLEICHHLLYGANHFLWSGCWGVILSLPNQHPTLVAPGARCSVLHIRSNQSLCQSLQIQHIHRPRVKKPSF